jgi:hypothetical protein
MLPKYDINNTRFVGLEDSLTGKQVYVFVRDSCVGLGIEISASKNYSYIHDKGPYFMMQYDNR